MARRTLRSDGSLRAPRSRVALGTVALGHAAWWFAACEGKVDVVATLAGEPGGTGGEQGLGGATLPSFGGREGTGEATVLELTGDLDVHDPTVIESNDSFYLFHTGPLLPMKTSSDLLSWNDRGSAFGTAPEWIEETLPNVTDLWAPDISRFGGIFHLYYAASTFGTGVSCIGHATSEALPPEGTFEDRGSVICSDLDGDTDPWDAIDPSMVTAEDGTRHLVFGSYSTGIYMIALDAEGNRAGDTLIHVASRPEAAIQAATALHRAPYYYLFATFDRCCAGVNSDSSIRVGRATSIEGPFVDRDGVAMLEGGGTLLLSGNEQYRGVGANSVFFAGETLLSAYHAYDANAAGQATLRISEIVFDAEDWPVSGGP